jgi:hypothetical protein
MSATWPMFATADPARLVDMASTAHRDDRDHSIDGRPPVQGPLSPTGGVVLGVARGIQYGLIAEADAFAERAEQLGAGLLRVFLYWSQLEPEPGRYDWTAVDALLEQIDDDTELWLMIGASSPWATVRSTDFLPSSPPLDPHAYTRMISALVEHCHGRVRWWQCENEPCNPLFWVGSAADYVAQLQVFASAVRTGDPDAQVVLGGCPPGVYPADGGKRDEYAFFQQLLDAAGDVFDAFDVHLYGDPYRIPATIAALRQSMYARGYDKPILVGEYNGPLPIQYPEALGALADVLRSGATEPWSRLSAHRFQAGKLSATPARDAMKRLYRRIGELPPQLQMFMTGCAEDLNDLRHRLNARDLVIRNVLALSCGVQRTVCWQIRPDVPAPPDRYEFLRLMFDKFYLLPYDDRMDARFPCADAFAELCARVTGAETVRRCELPRQPDIFLFEIIHDGRATALVGWLRHDGIDDDPEPRHVDRYGLTVAATPILVDLTASVDGGTRQPV